MYTTTNFKTKKALKDAVTNGKPVTVFQPGPFQGNEPSDGWVTVEGPHYPQPHRWYARALLQDGVVMTVKEGARSMLQCLRDGGCMYQPRTNRVEVSDSAAVCHFVQKHYPEDL